MASPLRLCLLLLMPLLLAQPEVVRAQDFLGQGGTSGFQQPPGRDTTRQITPPTYRTPVQRPQLLARIDRPFRDYMQRYTRAVEQLSRDCARSRFLPDRTLRIRFADTTVSVSMPNGKGLLIGRELAHPEVMYFFHYDGTTSCRVYSRATGPLG